MSRAVPHSISHAAPLGLWKSRERERLLTNMRTLGAHNGADVALNTLSPHPDYVGIICTRAVSEEGIK